MTRPVRFMTPSGKELTKSDYLKYLEGVAVAWEEAGEETQAKKVREMASSIKNNRSVTIASDVRTVIEAEKKARWRVSREGWKDILSPSRSRMEAATLSIRADEKLRVDEGDRSVFWAVNERGEEARITVLRLHS